MIWRSVPQGTIGYQAKVIGFLQRYLGDCFRACLLWEMATTVEAALAGRATGELTSR